jgi:N-acetylglucosamine kinase-like BadF-type ATPase
MILIADSGSTKTIWKCTDGAGHVFSAKTAGINPYYNTEKEIFEEITHARSQLSSVSVGEIFFYGAGCSTAKQKEMVAAGLRSNFHTDEVVINSDLVGAARALFQHDPGIVCILGTGSGSCIYDGEDILYSIPSLGFILGDEGSGAYLGKLFIRDYLREDMPDDILEEANIELGITKDEVLMNVNQNIMPSRYLAGFSKFIYKKIDHKYMHDLVFLSFQEFVNEYVIRYDGYRDYQIGFIGSIADRYRHILKEVLDGLNIVLGKIEKDPVAGLIEYHLLKD